MGAVNRTRTMDKRSLCCLIICVNLCFVIWLVSVQQLDTTDEVSGDAGAGARVSSMQLQLQSQPSANGSKPNLNQIHDSSRNFSNYYYYNYNYNPSLVVSQSDKAATPAPTPTAASRSSSLATPSSSYAYSPSSSSSQLIDLHNFAYLMAQPGCEPHIQVLILVHTAPHNAEKRSLIRQTWGSSSMTSFNSPLRLVFLLGGVSTTAQQQTLAHENQLHNDMVQGNFQDAYRNMTYKHVMALKWFNENCAQAQLMIKVDDDVYVNTPQLLKLLREPATTLPESRNSNLTTLSAMTTSSSSAFSSSSAPPATSASLRSLLQQHRELLFCRLVLESRVKRSYRSKWRVSFKEYPAHYYPPYCPGFAVIYSPDVVQRLYQAAQQSGYFWVDDVHITGVLAQQTNTTITNLQPYVLYKFNCERILKGESDLEEQEFLFTWHSIAPEQISALWQLHVAQNYTLTQRGVVLEPDMSTDTGLS